MGALSLLSEGSTVGVERTERRPGDKLHEPILEMELQDGSTGIASEGRVCLLDGESQSGFQAQRRPGLVKLETWKEEESVHSGFISTGFILQGHIIVSVPARLEEVVDSKIEQAIAHTPVLENVGQLVKKDLPYKVLESWGKVSLRGVLKHCVDISIEGGSDCMSESKRPDVLIEYLNRPAAGDVAMHREYEEVLVVCY